MCARSESRRESFANRHSLNTQEWRWKSSRERAINNSAGHALPRRLGDRISENGARRGVCEHHVGSFSWRRRLDPAASPLEFSSLLRWRSSPDNANAQGMILQEFIAPRETIPESGNILTWNLPIVTSRHSFVIVSRERTSLSGESPMRYRDNRDRKTNALLPRYARSK